MLKASVRAHVAFLLLQRETCDFFSPPKTLRTFSWPVPDARKSSEVLLKLKSEGMMDQVNFRASGDAWHPPSRLIELMS